MIRLQRPGQLAGDRGGLLGRLRAVQRRVQVDALAAAGHRHRIVPDVAQDVPDQQGDLSTVGQADARARIKIENEPVGVARLAVVAEAPLRHVDLQRGQLGQPGQRGQIVDHRVVVVVILVGDLVPGAPSPACRRPDPC